MLPTVVKPKAQLVSLLAGKEAELLDFLRVFFARISKDREFESVFSVTKSLGGFGKTAE